MENTHTHISISIQTQSMPFVWLISSCLLLLPLLYIYLQSNPFSLIVTNSCDRWHKINSSIIGLHASPYLYIVNKSDRVCFVTINRLMVYKTNIRTLSCSTCLRHFVCTFELRAMQLISFTITSTCYLYTSLQLVSISLSPHFNVSNCTFKRQFLSLSRSCPQSHSLWCILSTFS